MLKCRICDMALTLDDVFSKASWYFHGSFSFRCPRCEAPQLFRIEQSTVEVGVFDGFPGPVFMAESSQNFNDLSSVETNDTLAIYFGERRWFICAPSEKLVSKKFYSILFDGKSGFSWTQRIVMGIGDVGWMVLVLTIMFLMIVLTSS